LNEDESKRPTKKQKVSNTPQISGPSVRNVLAVHGELSRVGNSHDAKKLSSEAYKSIFSTQANCSASSITYFTGVSRGVIK